MPMQRWLSARLLRRRVVVPVVVVAVLAFALAVTPSTFIFAPQTAHPAPASVTPPPRPGGWGPYEVKGIVAQNTVTHNTAPNWTIRATLIGWFYLDAQNNSHFCSKVHTVEQWDCYANTHPCTGYSLKGQLERWDGVHWVPVNSVPIASHEGHGIFGNPPS